jgi:AraC-like DNA-binding protein
MQNPNFCRLLIDTARVLHVSPSTVIRELKKRTATTTSELAGIKAIEPKASKSWYLFSPTV